MSAALARVRLRTLRGSAAEGSPSGVRMSQNIREVGLGLAAPRQDLERGRIRLGQHVGFEDAGQALDRGPVESESLLEGAFHLGRGQGHGLERSYDVGEPQPHEPHVALFDRPQDKLLLAVHTGLFPVLPSAPGPAFTGPAAAHAFTLLSIATDC